MTWSKFRDISRYMASSAFKPVLYCAALVVASFFLFQNLLIRPQFATMSDSNWTDRAKSHPSPSSWTPSRSDLAFAVVRNGPVEHHALTLALFKPDIAIDAMGNILVLKSEDFARLTGLANKTPDLPETGTFRNTWVVDQPTTSQTIDRLLVPAGDSDYKQISVQGYAANKKQLKQPVGDVAELPDVLHELFGLISYSRAGYNKGSRNEDTLSKVLDIIGDP